MKLLGQRTPVVLSCFRVMRGDELLEYVAADDASNALNAYTNREPATGLRAERSDRPIVGTMRCAVTAHGKVWVGSANRWDPGSSLPFDVSVWIGSEMLQFDGREKGVRYP